jgi:hypothetical protein
MRYAVATVVIVAALGLGGYVLHGQGTIQVLGSGTSSCGQWLEDRETAGPDGYFLQDSWVNGYLTGHQDGDGEASGLTENQTSDLPARNAWIDNYCQANPLNDLTDAARGLWDELSSR